IIIGKGPGARTLRLDLPPFTLIGATVRAGMLTSPLRDRFGVVDRLDFYSPSELEQIINRSANILNVKVEEEGAALIARASRGTPRVANRLLKRVRDYAQVKADNIITKSVAGEALDMLQLDSRGLDEIDRRLLLALIEKYEGGPVGLDTLAACISEEPETLEDVYEPYLMQLGFLKRTARGRMVTREVYTYLNLKPIDDDQQKLW
ncbi:MAG: Holliday junction branch migration DNA helicase RuvB, partial [Dethiobacteria bacterium]